MLSFSFISRDHKYVLVAEPDLDYQPLVEDLNTQVYLDDCIKSDSEENLVHLFFNDDQTKYREQIVNVKSQSEYCKILKQTAKNRNYWFAPIWEQSPSLEKHFKIKYSLNRQNEDFYFAGFAVIDINKAKADGYEIYNQWLQSIIIYLKKLMHTKNGEVYKLSLRNQNNDILDSRNGLMLNNRLNYRDNFVKLGRDNLYDPESESYQNDIKYFNPNYWNEAQAITKIIWTKKKL